ncbi:hypothetical protein FS837_002155 [Tulasnella sp. UAMH 9824]|nr:hypothetical protein FS837_002155 [Tulasnella sp. UAMH 9824]
MARTACQAEKAKAKAHKTSTPKKLKPQHRPPHQNFSPAPTHNNGEARPTLPPSSQAATLKPNQSRPPFSVETPSTRPAGSPSTHINNGTAHFEGEDSAGEGGLVWGTQARLNEYPTEQAAEINITVDLQSCIPFQLHPDLTLPGSTSVLAPDRMAAKVTGGLGCIETVLPTELLGSSSTSIRKLFPLAFELI